MRYLWMCLAIMLSACGGSGSGQGPVPLQGTWAKFSGAIADDSQGSSVNSCAVNVLTLDGNVLTSHYHKPATTCDCSTVQPEQAASCVGEKINNDDTYTVLATVSDLLARVLRLSSTCPAIQGANGIPFIPPDCLGSSASELNRFSVIPVVEFPKFVVGANPARNELDINSSVIASSESYVTREGEQAHSVRYNNVEKTYENCELDAQIAFSIDASGHLVPARDPSVVSIVENPAELNLVPLEYHLSSESSQKCTVKAGTSDNANNTGIDNALSPYAGLDVEYEFGPLQEGVLTLDYEERFYKVK